MKRLTIAIPLSLALTLSAPVRATVGDTKLATTAINALGLDLLKKTTPGENALLSPYSIHVALAMTATGANGETRREMETVLHFSGAPGYSHGESIMELDEILREATPDLREQAITPGDSVAYVQLIVANRLYGQTGFDFRDEFLNEIKTVYSATLQPVDFVRNAAGASQEINAWVERKTRQRIQNIVSPDTFDSLTRLVLVNALYFKAPWASPASEKRTTPRPFRVNGDKVSDVPTMTIGGYSPVKRGPCTEITIPYLGGDLQFTILLPDENTSLSKLEEMITPEMLSPPTDAPPRAVIVELPKLEIKPPTMQLTELLKELGMRLAFADNADFSRMADKPLAISTVLHKTFLLLDEKGTEAAAATIVGVKVTSGGAPREVIKVDRPFLFAIQEASTGLCLFLGRMNDPR